MNRYNLDKKRLEPCVEEIYASSKGPTDECYPQNYETWGSHGVWAFYGGAEPVTVIPIDCYFLEKDILKKIVEKWCKGLHGFWYYTPKFTFGDPDYDKKKKELEDFRRFESDVENDKTLTYAQRAAKIKKEALAHNFIWRSRDKEYINFNVYLGVSPNSNKEYVERNHIIYHAIEDAAHHNKIINSYVDYIHMDSFEYIDCGNILHAKVEEVYYYHKNDNIIKVSSVGRKHCNLYNDDGDWVNEICDYVNVCRRMSADTLEKMIVRYKPIVIETLIHQGHEDVATWLNDNRYMDKDLKQCFAVWIMSQKWLSDNK